MKDKMSSHWSMESRQTVYWRKDLKKIFHFSHNHPLSCGKGETSKSSILSVSS